MEQEVAVLNEEEGMAMNNAVVRKACPKCGKLFKPSGLAGHLRFAHGYSGERASKLTKSAPADKATMYDRLFELVDKIQKIRDRRKTLEEKYSSFFTPDLIEEALSALEEQERRLTEELENLKGEKKEERRERIILGLHFPIEAPIPGKK